MFRFKPDKEPERYYLLPGMGGEPFRRKQLVFLKWSIIASLVISAVLAVMMYLINRFTR
jgi:hypothetical protein